MTHPLLDTMRFLLELAAVAALAVAGASMSWMLALVLPAVMIVVWGMFLAPKSTHRLADPAALGLEVVVFGGTGAALSESGRPVAGIVLAVLSIGNAVALRVTKLPSGTTRDR